MHSLKQVHVGPHIYGPGGYGWRALDIAPFMTFDHYEILRTIDLPGFVDRDRNVTYESHHFWLHFIGPASRGNAEVLVVVNHGGGWEVWRGDYFIARTIEECAAHSPPEALFRLCWSLRDIAESAMETGAAEASKKYRAAFVDGRLKKRKMPGRNATKVWIEPAASTP